MFFRICVTPGAINRNTQPSQDGVRTRIGACHGSRRNPEPISPHRATLRSAEGVDCALPDGKVPQKSDSLKSLGLGPRLSDFSQKWATISGCIFFQVPRFRVHASERENKTHTHTTRAKKGPVWLFLKRAPGGIKRGRGNPTNRPIRPASWLARSAFPYLAEVGEKKG